MYPLSAGHPAHLPTVSGCTPCPMYMYWTPCLHVPTPAKSSWTRFLPKFLTNLPKILTNLPKILPNLPKILPKVPRLCRPISGQDLGQDLTQDMARSQPPGKILASCQDLALLGKNLAQELFAGHCKQLDPLTAPCPMYPLLHSVPMYPHYNPLSPCAHYKQLDLLPHVNTHC